MVHMPSTSAAPDPWKAGTSYDQFMGRWSRRMAPLFVAWLAPPQDADWLEIGCGTGALTTAIVNLCAPRSLLAIEPSESFLDQARAAIRDPRVRFVAGSAQTLPAADNSIDLVTSGLVFNFIPDQPAALAEMRRVLKSDGVLGFYVWDYPGGGMGFIEAFWQAARELDQEAAPLHEAWRFPFCTPDGLGALCRDAGFTGIAVEPLESETTFSSFADYWYPFTLGTGPAPSYCASLSPEKRTALENRLADRLGIGPITLPARAWAVRARPS
jgi:SAM-dependent methyltransferase